MQSNSSDQTSNPNKPSGVTGLIDKENAFVLFAVFCGDVERTAHALNVNAQVITSLARDEGWDRKLAPIIELKQSSRPGDVERAINRAINFTQAHRYRLFLEKVLTELTGLCGDDLKAFLFPQEVKKKRGALAGDKSEVTQKFSTRSLADLAAAIEKCHVMTYLALGDSATERKERPDDDNASVSGTELQLKMARAMSQAGMASITPAGKVAEAQLVIAQQHASVGLGPQGSIVPSA